jgi:hypothetical protein|tara:strand:- start:4564 stop:5043 length:480 start_codon:yes stop_codon:yes gene_type:complete
MKYVLGLVFMALICFCLILFWPTNEADTVNINIENRNIFSEGEPKQSISSASNLITNNDDKRNEVMTSEYKVLEKERGVLKQRLARLKHHMWGLKFEKNKAKEMSEILLNAHRLIKNPNMLGAFSDTESIRDETMKVKFANKSLDRITEIILQKKQDNN